MSVSLIFSLFLQIVNFSITCNHFVAFSRLYERIHACTVEIQSYCWGTGGWHGNMDLVLKMKNIGNTVYRRNKVGWMDKHVVTLCALLLIYFFFYS